MGARTRRPPSTGSGYFTLGRSLTFGVESFALSVCLSRSVVFGFLSFLPPSPPPPPSLFLILQSFSFLFLSPPAVVVVSAVPVFLFPPVGGWIPDSREIHMTFAGSSVELKMKAGDLRAIDRPLQCKLALEALKSDPKVLQGKLEPAPPAIEVYGASGAATVGLEPGATGFARAPEAFPPTTSGHRSGGRGAGWGAGGAGGRASLGGAANAEFSALFGGSSSAAAAAAGFRDGGGGDDVYDNDGYDELDSTPKQRKKKRRKKTVVVPAAGAAGGGEGGSSVEYDLPLHVQIVEGKECSPTLRLKVI